MVGYLDTVAEDDDTEPAPRLDPLTLAEPVPDYGMFVPVAKEHYAVGKEIARGGMGRIVVARDRRLGRKVALKESLGDTGDAALRFEREARITARLQHPSIVNVHEAGVWPSGERFYSMKLVAGRSFDAVIAEAATLQTRLALLPTVLAIADAIAYAHSERVIHRDLKPHNVLVGSFGETVVIDWGLAKELDVPDELAALRSPGRAGSVETVDGEVMGTPAYMPPEQANGDAVDERADVYAIGAILYHVLSGVPPYTGGSAIAVLEALLEGPPMSLVARAGNVPADLLAIVERAMARDPAARYATAGELAADLRRYQTGQLVGSHQYTFGQLFRRWLRRHRASVSVAGAAAVIMLVLGALAINRILSAQHLAEEQRERARTSQAGTEELQNYMFVTLRNKLDSVGRLDLLGDVVDRTRSYYEGRMKDGEQSGLQQMNVATMRTNLGDVQSARGDVAGALAEYRAALGIHCSLWWRYGHLPSFVGELGKLYVRIGRMLFAQADTLGAIESYRTALQFNRRLYERDTTDVDAARSLALSLADLGNVLRARDQTAEALAAWSEGLALMERANQRGPVDSQTRRALAGLQERVADALLVDGGDGAAALALYRSSLAHTEELLEAEPGNAELQRDLSVSHNKLGDALSVSGKVAEALAEYRASLAIIEPLAASDPTNMERLRDVAITQSNVADMQLALGQTQKALVSFRGALVVFEKLAAVDLNNADSQQDLALAHLSIGDALRVLDDTRGSAHHYRTGLRIHEKLAAADPSNPHWIEEITTDRELLAKVTPGVFLAAAQKR